MIGSAGKVSGDAIRSKGNDDSLGSTAGTGRILPFQTCMRDDLVERDLTGQIISAFFHVYNRLGFGNLEVNHCRALELVLRERSIRVDREFPARVYFEGRQVGFHRVDMLVERKVIVEVKSTDLLPPFARRQVRNYLCALDLQVGLILHFGPQPRFHRLFVPRRGPAPER